MKDLEEELDPDLAIVTCNPDGIMIMCQNDEEGFYTIENMLKIKNLDYEPELYECYSAKDLENKK